LVSVWFIVEPEPEVAPAILPVLVPMFHEKVPEIEDVRLILILEPLHIPNVVELVTFGAGFTVTVIEAALPMQPTVEVGIVI
jgi:hypothetical protein